MGGCFIQPSLLSHSTAQRGRGPCPGPLAERQPLALHRPSESSWIWGCPSKAGGPFFRCGPENPTQWARGPRGLPGTRQISLSGPHWTRVDQRLQAGPRQSVRHAQPWTHCVNRPLRPRWERRRPFCPRCLPCTLGRTRAANPPRPSGRARGHTRPREQTWAAGEVSLRRVWPEGDHLGL